MRRRQTAQERRGDADETGARPLAAHPSPLEGASMSCLDLGDAHVIVTGGAGFIGHHLCHELLKAGARLTVLDNFASGDRANLRQLMGDHLRLIEHDVTQPWPIDDPVDAVVHLASLASPVYYMDLPIETLRVGSEGTLRALEYARRHRARFIVSSTSEVYGDPLIHPQVETYWGNVNPIGVRAVYDEGKRFTEAATVAYAREYGLSTGIARLFNTYGPGMRLDDGRAIPTMACQALEGTPISVSGDGSQTRSFCYVSDTVAGLIALLTSDVAGPVNLGNPQEITLLELAQRLRQLTGEVSDISFVPRPHDDPSVRKPCIDAAQRLLGWAPVVALEEGLRRTVESFAAILPTHDPALRERVRFALERGLTQDRHAAPAPTLNDIATEQSESARLLVDHVRAARPQPTGATT